MSDTINPNANITVSKEEKITIANDDASSNLNKKPLITVQTEKEILEKINKHCKTWNDISIAYNVCIIIFGLSAISTSVLVSIYTGQKELIRVEVIKVLACISTISLSILTAFNLVSNASSARTAWRSLNAAMMLYKAGSMSIQQLIEQYQKGESQIGNLSFNYGTNSDKPATYSHDIKGKDDDPKQIREDKKPVSEQNEEASEPNPAASEQNPAASEPNPAANEPNPAANEPNPAASEHNPAASEPNPAASEQNVGASKQNVDVSKQSTDASGQNVDSGKQT